MSEETEKTTKYPWNPFYKFSQQELKDASLAGTKTIEVQEAKKKTKLLSLQKNIKSNPL